MKVIVCGGGPTGLRMCEQLLGIGYYVELYEKQDNVGGCWKINWSDGYFTEHSPRVVVTSYHRFLELIKSFKLETYKLYGNSFSKNILFGKYIFNNFSFIDKFKLFYAIYLQDNSSDKRTVQKWMDDVKLSNSGKKGLTKLCIDIAMHPKYLSYKIAMKTFKEGTNSNFVQIKSGDLWIKKYKEKLIKKGLKIYYNSELIKLKKRGSIITSAIIENNEIQGDMFVLCMPLYSLRKVLKNSYGKEIKDNWMDWEKFKQYVKYSTYSGLGIQFHFKQKQTFFKNKLCATCMSDWSIITMHTSEYLTQYSKRKEIKDVYSLVIVDTETKSKFIKKSADECETHEELIEEVLRQIKETTGYTLRPDMITFSKDLHRKKNHWYAMETAFGITPKGYLPPKGKIDNLFSVGPHNLEEVAVLENAFISADNCIDLYF